MNASSPITFEPKAAGRELAKLGVVQVGVVWLEREGRDDAWWRVMLPDAPARVYRAPTIDDAKERLISKVAEWLEAAGLAPMSAATNDHEAGHER